MLSVPRSVLLRFCDIVFSNLVIAPLNIFFWKGTWELYDLYFFPHNQILSAWINLAFSVGISMSSYIFQQPLLGLDLSNTTIFFILTRVYAYIISIASVGHWRSIWLIIDLYTDDVWLSCILCMAGGCFTLGILRGLKAASGPPFIVVTDTSQENFFKISTFLDARVKGKPWFVFDVTITVLIIHSLVAAIWRGAWVYQDYYLLPDNFLFSSLISLYIGYLLSFAIYSSEKLVVYAYKKSNSSICLRACVEDTYTLLIIFSSVCVWRGIWNMQNLYWTNRRYLSNWVSHGAGFIGLMLIHATLSIPARGYNKDFSTTDGEGISAPIHYFEIMLDWYRANGKGKEIRDLSIPTEDKENEEATTKL